MKNNPMILFVFSFLVGCMNTTTNAPDKWQTHIDEANHFSINYPDMWQKNIKGSTLTFLSSKENDKDGFNENVNIIVQDLSKQPINIEEYTALTKKQVVSAFGESAIISLKNIKLGNFSAKEMVYNMNYKGRNLKIKQDWVVKGNTAYLLTYTAEPQEYDHFLETASKIMDSLKFL